MKQSFAACLLSLLAAFGAGAPVRAETVRVGVTPGPDAQILEQVVPEAKKLGLDVKIVEFADYILPNQALAQKDIEINAFQHEPYLKNQLARAGWKLTPIAHTYVSPMGFYSKKYKSFDEVPAGAKIAIQNDPSNGARSLQLLAANNIVRLREGAGAAAGLIDIAANPKNFKFVELDAAQLPRSLPDVDVAAINSNYAIEAGFSPIRDAILKEAPNGPWANIVVVREEDRNKPWAATFVKAYQSAAVKAFLLERFKGAYLPAW